MYKKAIKDFKKFKNKDHISLSETMTIKLSQEIGLVPAVYGWHLF